MNVWLPLPGAIATETNSVTPQDQTNQKLQKRLAELQRDRQLIAADSLYLGGQFAAAEKIYRQVKTPLAQSIEPKTPEPVLDPAYLSPAGKVYWRETRAGVAQNLQTRTLVPLRLLVEQYPEFIPGHLRLAEILTKYDKSEDALAVLEKASALYPTQPEIVKAKIAALAAEKKWMEASLTARQFALLNYNQPQQTEFTLIAEENLKRYKSHLRGQLRGNAIANVITGALGYALTGSIFGPISAVQTTAMLLQGESSVGKSVSKQARKQLEMVEDPDVVNYVNEIGQKLAVVAGRNDFEYEFFVIMDDDLNAFALPGGKVFVNAGSVAKTNSEAELAGLLAHELSHAVLSHGFQLVAEGNLVANVTQYVPLGNTVANLFVLNYSRDMEKQADTLGTRLLSSTGYAADGLRNLMIILEAQEKNNPPSWLSSHPATENRVDYLEKLIVRNQYNRYAYEGVGQHAEIKAKVKKLLVEQKHVD
ncbi:M48 family metallopeptidase [Synechocystis sp. PCC 7509]|uniref:M48 family metallopeptidase n=1 Tax=Synechocystis sp. PCC 7509 TaxID=927677 RepID=UPI0002ABA8ED|nr:M48 family metallopeptidase [Synechocystis sp. PCC 7509]